jgi:hypothetical protein
MPELEATAPPIPFWFYRVVAGAAEPWGQLRLAVVELIAATTIKTGLKVESRSTMTERG